MKKTFIVFFLSFFCFFSCKQEAEPLEEETTENTTQTEPSNEIPTTEVENTSAPTIKSTSSLQNLIIKTGEEFSTVTFNLEAEPSSDNQTINYQWYEGLPENGKIIRDANTNTFTPSKITTKGIYNYYCKITGSIPDNGDGGVKSAENICKFSAAYTGLPTVIINTKDNEEITSKEDWMKKTYFSITGAENEDYNFEDKKVSIRGRGNASWGCAKKPYALKFNKETPHEILGMPSHTRWVLIANYLDNSFMRNEMAFYLSEQLGMDYTVHGKFVDLVLNGEYKGLYWLGEAIKIDENRVNISEEDDYLIEIDVYYDETWKFKTAIKNLPYMIQNDDYMTPQKLARLNININALELLLYPDFADETQSEYLPPDESYREIIDIESWAKFYLVNEIMDNGELGHPKSSYFTYDGTNNIFKAGPVWDFDWASLAEHNTCILTNTIYYDALFKSSSFIQKLKEIMSEKVSVIDINSKIEELRSQISIAANYDAELWGVNHNPTGLYFEDFDGHVDFLKETLNNKLEVVKETAESL